LRGLLAESVTSNQQADGEIHEDQLLNFLVNTLTGAFSLNLGENAEIDPDDIFEVLVGACADGTSSHSDVISSIVIIGNSVE
jgi:hypothetical protein